METSFFAWIGLKRTQIQSKKSFILALIAIVVLFAILFPLNSWLMSGIAGHENIASSQFTGLGSKGFIPALIYAFIQTALTEEIFFRGFLGKRISSKFGFIARNIIQAFLFGLLHGVMFFRCMAYSRPSPSFWSLERSVGRWATSMRSRLADRSFRAG